MGQFNPSTGPGINPKINEDITISVLINSTYYFIESVYILLWKNKYRLVVLHHNHVLLDQEYPTIRGCRIAFSKIYSDRAWSENIKPEWTPFYAPDQKWVEEKQNRIEAVKMTGFP